MRDPAASNGLYRGRAGPHISRAYSSRNQTIASRSWQLPTASTVVGQNRCMIRPPSRNQNMSWGTRQLPTAYTEVGQVHTFHEPIQAEIKPLHQGPGSFQRLVPWSGRTDAWFDRLAGIKTCREGPGSFQRLVPWSGRTNAWFNRLAGIKSCGDCPLSFQHLIPKSVSCPQLDELARPTNRNQLLDGNQLSYIRFDTISMLQNVLTGGRLPLHGRHKIAITGIQASENLCFSELGLYLYTFSFTLKQ